MEYAAPRGFGERSPVDFARDAGSPERRGGPEKRCFEGRAARDAMARRAIPVGTPGPVEVQTNKGAPTAPEGYCATDWTRRFGAAFAFQSHSLVSGSSPPRSSSLPGRGTADRMRGQPHAIGRRASCANKAIARPGGRKSRQPKRYCWIAPAVHAHRRRDDGVDRPYARPRSAASASAARPCTPAPASPRPSGPMPRGRSCGTPSTDAAETRGQPERALVPASACMPPGDCELFVLGHHFGLGFAMAHG